MSDGSRSGATKFDLLALCLPTRETSKKFKSQRRPWSIYVSGQLRYEDIFGKVWTEEFRAFKWSPSGEREKMSFAAIKDEAPGVELLDG